MGTPDLPGGEFSGLTASPGGGNATDTPAVTRYPRPSNGLWVRCPSCAHQFDAEAAVDDGDLGYLADGSQLQLEQPYDDPRLTGNGDALADHAGVADQWDHGPAMATVSGIGQGLVESSGRRRDEAGRPFHYDRYGCPVLEDDFCTAGLNADTARADTVGAAADLDDISHLYRVRHYELSHLSDGTERTPSPEGQAEIAELARARARAELAYRMSAGRESALAGEWESVGQELPERFGGEGL
jgi:hypothetical protein